MVTIKDVAREAGVSVTTASRGLNNHSDVAETTRVRVHAAASTLGYHPNAAARSLQNRRANAVGLAIPLTIHRAQDPFWFDFIGGMASACADRGIDLMISGVDGRHGPESFQRLLRGNRVDGMLICDIRQEDPRIAALQRQHVPFVAFGRTTGPHNYAYIDVDGEAGVIEAMDHLIQLGHRRTAYLGIDAGFGFAHYRAEGYRKALVHAGIAHDRRMVHEGLDERTVGPVLDALLRSPRRPTAILAAADVLAVATLKMAKDRGFSIPRDLSVIAFDDSPIVRHAEPAITAISQPNRRLGEEGAILLMDRVNDPGSPLVQRLVTPKFVKRNSTAPPVSPG